MLFKLLNLWYFTIHQKKTNILSIQDKADKGKKEEEKSFLLDALHLLIALIMKICRSRIKEKRLKLYKLAYIFKVLIIKKGFLTQILLYNYHIIYYLHFSDEQSKVGRVTSQRSQI